MRVSSGEVFLFLAEEQADGLVFLRQLDGA